MADEKKKKKKKSGDITESGEIIPPKSYLERKNLGLIVLVALIILAGVLFFRVIRVFLIPIILSATFTSLFYPLYKRLNNLLKNRRSLSAFLFCFMIVTALFIPLYIIAHLAVVQAIEIYNVIQAVISGEETDIIRVIRESQIAVWLSENQIDWFSALRDSLSEIGRFITNVINKTSVSIIEGIVGVFFTLFSMFYMFRDGDKFIHKIRALSPLKQSYERKIMGHFAMISRATVKGTIVIGLVQGTVSSIALMAFGIQGWVLWGLIIIILSIIPMVGAPIVMIPIGIMQISYGNIWQGIVILIIGVVVNTVIDYLLRPPLVGKEGKMHNLVVLFSTLGGIATFGIMGFIIGPVIAMFFMSLLEIYREEFSAELSNKNRRKVKF
jgi:predicted PurR-regulated permease PerM